jgi:hypothetical protein
MSMCRHLTGCSVKKKKSVYAAIKYASEAMEKTSAEKPVGGGSIIATASGKSTFISLVSQMIEHIISCCP